MDWTQAFMNLLGGGSVLGLIGLLMKLRKDASRDSVDRAKDRAESAIVPLLQQREADALVRCEKLALKNSELSETLAGLRRTADYQAEEIARLHTEHMRFQRRLLRRHPDLRDEIETDFSALSPSPTGDKRP